MMNAARFRELVSGKRRGPLAFLQRAAMRVISMPYGVVVNVRNRRFDRAHTPIHRAAVPVISVGNITLGGTGKTPMVEWIARWLRAKNVRVTLVSRGYKAEAGSANDEALALEELLPDVPHIQNADRVAAAEMAIEEFEAQAILLDDAFQHRRISRDLDIVLIDATEPFGFDHLFPRGTLRESLRGLARADLIAITRADCVDEQRRAAIESRILQFAPDTPIAVVTHAPQSLRTTDGNELPLSTLAEADVVAFCGIGNPHGFEQTIATCDMQLSELREFPDHHAFTRADIDSLHMWAEQTDAAAVLCTHKDLVKIRLSRLGGKPLYALAIGLGFVSGEEALTSLLTERCLDRIRGAE